MFLASCSNNVKRDELSTRFENSNGKESAPYLEGIEWWKKLDKAFQEVRIVEFGMTDAGYPLHLITISKSPIGLSHNKSTPVPVILINNAIHPGEPDGVDASMMLFRDLLYDRNQLLDSCILVCIPYYNIGGALNRNSHSRTNQLGPKEYGFRGNAQNLDLNRDFVKCDSKNAESFAKLLQLIDPDVYIETHVSNGANYQYNITYLSTQPDKLGNSMGSFLRNEMLPSIRSRMASKGNSIVPYVNVHGSALDDHYNTFYDSPRYSSGLTTLHNIFGFITETHMLKPYDKRVHATYDYLEASIEFCVENGDSMKAVRVRQKKNVAAADSFAIDWEQDTLRADKWVFEGYEHDYKPSDVTTGSRLYYDTTKPITKHIGFYGYMNPKTIKSKPKYYALKKGFNEVEERLIWNGVELKPFSKDTIIEVVSFRIKNYETVNQAYEKHYLHFNSSFDSDTIKWQFRKGDYLIKMGTDRDRFIVEMLEPEGPDSYFNWNFFDAVIQQKEWYSPYVFEDKAKAILDAHPELQKQLDKKMDDPDFASNPRTQLHWVYIHSEHYEKEHKRLPIFRIE